MKLMSSYIKEMKIASRGFYFYIEIFTSIIMLIILIGAVKENPISKDKEFIYYDMSATAKDYLIQREVDKGIFELATPTEFKLKATSFEVINDITGETDYYSFDESVIELTTYKYYERNTGKLDKTLYITESEEDTIRFAYSERKFGAAIALDESGNFLWRYYTQGYETNRLKNLLYVFHVEDTDVLEEVFDRQNIIELGEVKSLNNRETLVPMVLVFMGSLMGFFIVMAYIYLDKTEGVIRAFAVSPSPMWMYLLSKTLVIITTVVISSTIITIPVMGMQPNYILFYLMLIISTFAFASLGLLVASYFDNISKAFSVLYFIMVFMMIPAFSYYVPSFDPLWIRFVPTYPLLQVFKEILMVKTDVLYVLTYCGVFLIGGIAVFVFANHRFKKTLTL